MKNNPLNRRTFLKKTAITSAAVGLTGGPLLANVISADVQTKLPRWRGFNLLDFFSPVPRPGNDRNTTTEDDFRWMRDWGFDFVRLPMAYPRYLDIDYNKNITPEEVFKIDEKKVEEVDKLVDMAHKYKLHVSLNLHRAPGYCVNSGFHEPYNLWKDQEAQDAFNFHWNFWGTRYKGMTNQQVSFDLVNEPGMREDMNDQHSKRSSVPGDVYRKVAVNALAAIREANPNHLVIADGNDTGSSVIPEIADLDIAQSCRGYFPHYISHYKAPWAYKNPESLPDPKWPGDIDGRYYSKKDLEEFYKPWIGLAKQGVGVHCGECGCWIKTPHAIFLAWFGDVLDILTENNIGWGLWNFRGDFGLLDSNREDVVYEDWHGHKLDRKLLTLLQNH